MTRKRTMQSLAQRRAAALHPSISESTSSEPTPSPSEGSDESTARAEVREPTLVGALVRHLADWGVEESFGVSGGAIALLFDALAESSVRLRHFRHETGAAFAACEAHFASRKPTLVFSTTGPGLLNALTGVTAAKWEGAKVILISGHTNAAQRGRWATQETSSYTLPQDALYAKSALFDFAVRMESASELPEILRRLASGLERPGGFVAHVCVPMSVQSSRVSTPRATPQARSCVPTASDAEVAEIAGLLAREPFAVWAGFGATRASSRVLELVERTGAKVFCSPRAKGVVPERHPQYLGVTGLGGHDAVVQHMVQDKPRWTLVLGTRLGEATSFWDRDLLPSEGLIQVDLDPEVPGAAFPDFPTLGIHSEIGHFLDSLLEHLPTHTRRRTAFSNAVPFDDVVPLRLAGRSPVRPQVLMEAIQRQVVDATDAVVMSECGNAFAWCNHHLRFDAPERYRVSTLFGSMGHTAAGVVGAALARRGKAVAVVGDGSMLMNAEISTAVQYGAEAVWIVLNDAGYGMCRDGHQALGLTDQDVEIPCVDFTPWARSQGARGITVDSEDELDAALEEALEAEGPFVVDVRIDPNEASPLLQRFESLIQQGNSKNVAGWER